MFVLSGTRFLLIETIMTVKENIKVCIIRGQNCRDWYLLTVPTIAMLNRADSSLLFRVESMLELPCLRKFQIRNNYHDTDSGSRKQRALKSRMGKQSDIILYYYRSLKILVRRSKTKYSSSTTGFNQGQLSEFIEGVNADFSVSIFLF